MSKAKEEEIYQVLKTAILKSDLTPGTQLVEQGLAESFAVSRTPIRSVLRRLEYESMVKIIPNRGAFVSCPSPEEAEQIFAVRKLLEPQATALAAKHATEAQLQAMEEYLTKEMLGYQRKEPHLALEAITAFHLAIVEASHNAYLSRYLGELIDLTHLILTFYDTADVEAPESPQEHQAILQAIRSRDVGLAEQLARQHVDTIAHDIDFSKPLRSSLSIDQVIQKYQGGM